MKKILKVVLVAGVVLGVTAGYAQFGSSSIFPPPPASGSGSGSEPPSTFSKGGGIGPNDINPPPDPVDVPIDAGIIFLLIIGTAYGVTRMKKEGLSISN
jgi:hypothetical protein